jgi:hypothetical protein
MRDAAHRLTDRKFLLMPAHILPSLAALNINNARPPILSEGLTVEMLRSEEHAEEKNDRMMAILNTKRWWIEYKRKFDARRKLDENRFNALLPRLTDPYPKHPSKKVYEIEKYVDEQMRLKYPDYVSGRRD